MHNEVMKFIDRFTMRGKWSEVLTSFTCGCCYWFAFILCSRFPEAVMMYDPVINHFVTQIDGQLYDITGEVTQEYKVVRWDTYPDELEKQRIEKYCINF